MLEKNAPLETIKTEYKRAWDYCQQGKYAEARALAYALLETEQAGAKWYADVILSQAEENSIKCLTHLKALLQTDQPMPWAHQRFKQIKSELLDEAGHALGRYDYPLAENILKLIFEVAPNDPTAMVLRDFVRQSKVPMPEETAAAKSESHNVASAQHASAEHAAISATPPAAARAEVAKSFSASAETQVSASSNEAFTISIEGAAPSTATEKEQILVENKIADHQRATSQVEKHAHIAPEKTIWQLYPVAARFKLQELVQIVDEYRKAGRRQELAAWLNERIGSHPRYAPHYVELARLYEEETREIDEAHKILHNLLTVQLADPSAEKWMKETAWNLLQFCKRNDRADLAQKLYDAVKNFNLDLEFLKELTEFAKPSVPANSSISNVEEQVAAARQAQETAQALDQSLQEARSSEPALKVARRFEAPHLNGRVGLFIDHENFWKGVMDVNSDHAIQLPSAWWEKAKWLDEILRALLAKAKDKFQRVAYRVAVGYWQHYDQASFLPAYLKHKFIPLQPEIVSALAGPLKNGVDFKLADEIRRAQQQALWAGSPLRQIIIVSGDGDFAHLAGNLVDEEILVQIWSMEQTINKVYREIIGEENIVFLDEDCLYRQ